jgi:DNA-directed RNA polymerase specialized sigma24 family protein
MAAEAKKKREDLPESALCDLMQGYLDGRIDAFDGLYAALSGRIRGYLLSQCRNPTLADLLRETFLQMHRSRRTTNRTAGHAVDVLITPCA